MNRVIVQKYGGSSVASVEKIGLVADRVVEARRSGHGVVVVVSAMGKTTDELVALATRVAADPPRRELDMLVSTGERVTMSLLSIAIQKRGERAISFTGSQSGIITDDKHFDARIVEVRPHRIEDALARGMIVIVAGYQGMSLSREITTLGRGGSDTTAVALAAALDAERCEIYSDVDGVYSADPRVVPAAEHLPELDLASLQEMAESGAKVLNAQAVEWARRAGVSIVARRTGDAPAVGARETVCHEHARTRARAVVGLAAVAHVVVTNAVPGAVARVRARVAEARLTVLDARLEDDAFDAVVPLTSVPDWDALSAALVADGATVTRDRALVSVVGDGLGTMHSHARAAAALAHADIHATRWAVSPLRLSAFVPAARVDEAARALHGAFCVINTALKPQA